MKHFDFTRLLINLMIIATVALAVAITIAKMPPVQEPDGQFYWHKLDHKWDLTAMYITMNDDGEQITKIAYHKNDKPFFDAYYKGTRSFAFKLDVDMDQDGEVDFSVLDFDDDGYLDFHYIFCYENCEEVTRRALLLFEGNLILEKTI